ncbi:MAG: hypothetical protein AAF433_03870 [Bacteroidota bacterium]
MNHLIFSYCFLLVLAGLLPRALSAQDNQNYEVALRLGSPTDHVQGYVYQVQPDTLYLSNEIGPVNATNSILAYPASRIHSIRIPRQKTTRNNFGLGLLIGTGVGLLVGVATQPNCNGGNSAGTLGCGFSSSFHVPSVMIIGALGGGIVGLFVRSGHRSSRTVYDTTLILGRPERLQAQRDRLEQLIRREQR